MRKPITLAAIITLIALNAAAFLVQGTLTTAAQQGRAGAVYRNGQLAPAGQQQQGAMRMQQGQMPVQSGQSGQMMQQQGQMPVQSGQSGQMMQQQQGQIPAGSGQQTQSSPIPGQMPGTPGKQQSGDWNLSELLYGIMQLDKTNEKISRAQAAKIAPMLTKVVEATQLITETQTILEKVLTKEQMAFIKDAQKRNALKLDVQLGPGKPGEDPLVAHVIGLLEKKAK